jgi:formylglycine-generating enzyme required for sulfatase activity
MSSDASRAAGRLTLPVVLPAILLSLFADALPLALAQPAVGKRDRPPLLDCRKGVSAEEVRRAQQAWAKYLGRQVEEEVEVGGGVKMTFVLVPPGIFLMGCPKEEEDYLVKMFGRERDDLASDRQHEVTLTEPFDLGKTEVTQAQYKALGPVNPSSFKGDDLPVEHVSWHDARGWAEKLTTKHRGKYLYRLPTEAEWEYGCRGGRSPSQPFGVGDGRTLSSRQANFNGNHPYGEADFGGNLEATCRVAKYDKNAMGLYDMHGNVTEWCLDNFDAYPRGAVTNPTGPEEKMRFPVYRGGCWVDHGFQCRAAERGFHLPDTRLAMQGFRLARSLPSVFK